MSTVACTCSRDKQVTSIIKRHNSYVELRRPPKEIVAAVIKNVCLSRRRKSKENTLIQAHCRFYKLTTNEDDGGGGGAVAILLLNCLLVIIFSFFNGIGGRQIELVARPEEEQSRIILSAVDSLNIQSRTLVVLFVLAIVSQW